MCLLNAQLDKIYFRNANKVPSLSHLLVDAWNSTIKYLFLSKKLLNLYQNERTTGYRIILSHINILDLRVKKSCVRMFSHQQKIKLEMTQKTDNILVHDYVKHPGIEVWAGMVHAELWLLSVILVGQPTLLCNRHPQGECRMNKLFRMSDSHFRKLSQRGRKPFLPPQKPSANLAWCLIGLKDSLASPEAGHLLIDL